MPSITYDGQAFAIDGRKVWLVSGAIHYPRIPRELWADRIRAAKQAGLNCIETYVFWSFHESAPGEWDWAGDKDLRHFIELIGDHGMYCLLRPGPYVCSEWDFGGLPAYFHRVPGIKPLRCSNPPYLAACERMLREVMDRVRDLQVTQVSERFPQGGPIVLMQVENEWVCHNPAEEEAYHQALIRVMREGGCDVPLINCNFLMQRVRGTIDAANGRDRIIQHIRELHHVQPDAPSLYSEYWAGMYDKWGVERPHFTDATAIENHLAQMAAAGGQPNIYMFHGGTNFEFWNGRNPGGRGIYPATTYDSHAPLTEAGGRGPKYLACKRICTFLTQFEHVMANLRHDDHHAVIEPKPADDDRISLVHQKGSRGDVLFIMRGAANKLPEVEVVLPDSRTLTVPLGDARTAWMLLDADLNGVAVLSYTTLRPWAFLANRLLVVFGPAGAAGVVSINSKELSVTVPGGDEPVVHRHEGLSVAVLNEAQVDAAYITRTGLVVGTYELDRADKPVPLEGWPRIFQVGGDGRVSSRSAKRAAAPTPPRLTAWEMADVGAMIDGTSPRYQRIDGPASFESLGCDFGYGWYRFTVSTPGTLPVLAPEASDRVHLFNDGRPVALLGTNAGAEDGPGRVRMDGQVTALVENAGRFNIGWPMGEPKGIYGHLWTVRPVKLARPRVEEGVAPNPFQLWPYTYMMRVNNRAPADSLVWTLTPKNGRPIVLDFRDTPRGKPAMIIVNGRMIDGIGAHFSFGNHRLKLEVGRELREGSNELRLAFFTRLTATDVRAVAEAVHAYQAVDAISEGGEWAFAPWLLPERRDFGQARATRGLPSWYRTTFQVRKADVPLWLEPRGMSKGVIILNGHNVGRFFVATADGKRVPPQHRYYLPEPWLRTDAPNELIVFDEHGKSPRGSRLSYDRFGPFEDQRPTRTAAPKAVRTRRKNSVAVPEPF